MHHFPIAVILLFPLAGAVIIGLGGRRLSRVAAGIIGVLSAAGTAVFAFAALYAMLARATAGQPMTLYQKLGTWLVIPGLSGTHSMPGLNVGVGLIIDTTSIVFLLLVTGVGTLIHIYVSRAMLESDSAQRVNAVMNLMLLMMLILVLADNLALMLAGWVGSGVATYLLAGHSLKDKAGSLGARKAFIINVIGDAAFLAGIAVLFMGFGTLSHAELFEKMQWMDMQSAHVRSGIFSGMPYLVLITAGAGLFAIAAAAKSALIPFHVWLPDTDNASAGISAMIQGIGAPLAGIYLMIRFHSLFSAAPWLLTIVGGMAALTALIAALIAISQTDINRILSFSSVSMMGIIFLGIAAGDYNAAVSLAVIHVLVKSLMFLGAGSITNQLDGERDIRRMGGLAGKMKITFITMLIGALVLSGFPATGGFFALDNLMSGALIRAFTPGVDVVPYLFLGYYILALIAVFSTGLYLFRMVLLIFLGRKKTGTMSIAPVTEVKESSRAMTYPMMILAGTCLIAGLFDIPSSLGGSRHLAVWLNIPGAHVSHLPATQTDTDHAAGMPATTGSAALNDTSPHSYSPALSRHVQLEWSNISLVTFMILLGVGLAWLLYGGRKNLPPSNGTPVNAFHRLSLNEFSFNEIYDALIVTPFNIIAFLAWLILDVLIINGIGSFIGKVTWDLGLVLKQTQTGKWTLYATVAACGGLLVLGTMLWLLL